MPRLSASTALVTATAAAALTAPGLRAQGTSLGTFRWQLQPYCNVLTVSIVQDGGQYHIDGTDDQCGAARKASVVGLAFPNPDGTIGFGLTTVTTPGGTPVHLDARISLATISGPWSDSAGNGGTFAFSPNAGSGGSPRPVPASGIAPGTIAAAQLAPGAVGGSHINSAEVQARVSGTCPSGQYLRGVRANGTVLCESLATGLENAVIPSGQTVVGMDTWDYANLNTSASVWLAVTLPARAPVDLSDVHFAPDVLGRVIDGDTTCTGTATAPTAPPGKVCLYIVDSYNINGAAGRAPGFVPPLLRARVFQLRFSVGSPTFGVDAYLNFTWAYTAP